MASPKLCRHCRGTITHPERSYCLLCSKIRDAIANDDYETAFRLSAEKTVRTKKMVIVMYQKGNEIVQVRKPLLLELEPLLINGGLPASAVYLYTGLPKNLDVTMAWVQGVVE